MLLPLLLLAQLLDPLAQSTTLWQQQLLLLVLYVSFFALLGGMIYLCTDINKKGALYCAVWSLLIAQCAYESWCFLELQFTRYGHPLNMASPWAVLVQLLLWGRGDAFTLSILGENGLSINLYTILFIAFFGIGYGAYYATADMPIPMVADCSDYETYRSGKYIPGIMGTLFSLVDKLVSSLSATVVGIAVSFVGLQSLPTQYDPYTPGMNWVVIVLFCIIPMVAWAATLIAMKGYTLTGAKMKEIQAVNACRRDAVAKGMKLEEAMDKWQTVDQLPAEYRS